MKLPKSLVIWLEEHRGLVIVLFCLPASFIFDLLLKVARRLKTLLWSNRTNHVERVLAVQTAVNAWNSVPVEKRKFMCTARPNWLSMSMLR